MYWIAFGRWSYKAGKTFARKRVYYKGYIWTPFVHIRRRY